MIKNPIIVGILAALASATMLVVFSSAGFLVLFAVLLGPLPIYIASLGWGTHAGVVGALGTIALTALLASPAAGMMIGMSVVLPAALAGHQTNLAQPREDNPDQMDWFPLSSILFWLAIFISASLILLGFVTGYDPADIAPALTQQMQLLIQESSSMRAMTNEELGQLVSFNLKLLPFIIGGFWIAIHVLNYLGAMKITRRMGVLARPEEDVAQQMSLPPVSLAILFISLVGMVFVGPPLVYGFTVLGGAFLFAAAVVGLAVMHERSRNWGTRTAVLAMSYLAIVFLPMVVILFSIIGIAKITGKSTPKIKD